MCMCVRVCGMDESMSIDASVYNTTHAGSYASAHIIQHTNYTRGLLYAKADVDVDVQS